MTEWYLLGLGILLTIGTGFFVASEFSLINLERSELEKRQDQGERGLAPTIRALKRSSTHLSSAQIGITVTTMLTGFLAEPSLAKIIEPTLSGFDLEPGTVSAISIGISLTAATVFSFLIGELIPKNAAIASPLPIN